MDTSSGSVFKNLIKDRISGIGLVIIFTTFLLGLLGYMVTPDKLSNANTMNLPIAGKSPGFKVEVLHVPLQQKVDIPWTWIFTGKPNEYEQIAVQSARITTDKIFFKKYKGEGAEVPEESIALADFGTKKPFVTQKKFWLGTDRYGRDMLSRLLLGARVSLSVGFISIFISLLIGIPLGLIAGYYKGKVDAMIMWLINVIWSIPTLLMVIALTLVMGKGFWQVFVAVGLTMWVEVARIVRGQVLSIREKEYVDAARVLGYSDFRIMWKHILPNAIGPVIVISAANFASAILIESGLSFLGIGAQPPVSSWGSMIRDHYGYIVMGKPYLALLPGLCIMLMVLSFMMIGNRLRDLLDVRENG